MGEKGAVGFVLAEAYQDASVVETMTQHRVIMASFRSWQDFTVILADTAELWRCLSLSDRIKHSCVTLLRDLGGEEEGTPCAVEDRDNSQGTPEWKRCRFLWTEEEEGVVELVDEGGRKKFPRASIRAISKDLVDVFPPVALHCRLGDSPDASDLPDNPMESERFKDGAMMTFLELENNGCYAVQIGARPTHQLLEEEEEDDVKKQKRENMLLKLEDGRGKSLKNWKRVMSYEPCRVVKVFATCIYVERGGGVREKVEISSEQCSLYGGSLREARLDNIFMPGDLIEVSAHKNSYSNAAGEVTSEEWVGRDMRDPALSHYLRTGRYPSNDFIAFGSINRVEEDCVVIMSRLFQLAVYAPLSAFKKEGGRPTNEKYRLEDVAPMFRTCVMRVKTFRLPRAEATAVEVFDSIEDHGFLYMVREQYSVILRTGEGGGKRMGEALECRYVFVPNGVVQAQGFPMEDWYGRYVVFVAVADQPDIDESGVPRWKGIHVEIMYDASDKNKRGDFKHTGSMCLSGCGDDEEVVLYRYPGIWRPKGAEEGTMMGIGRRGGEDGDDRQLSIPASLVRDWNEEGLRKRDGGTGPRAQVGSSEGGRGSGGFQPTVYRPTTSTMEAARKPRSEEAMRRLEVENQRLRREREAGREAGSSGQGDFISLPQEPETAMLIDLSDSADATQPNPTGGSPGWSGPVPTLLVPQTVQQGESCPRNPQSDSKAAGSGDLINLDMPSQPRKSDIQQDSQHKKTEGEGETGGKNVPPAETHPPTASELPGEESAKKKNAEETGREEASSHADEQGTHSISHSINNEECLEGRDEANGNTEEGGGNGHGQMQNGASGFDVKGIDEDLLNAIRQIESFGRAKQVDLSADVASLMKEIGAQGKTSAAKPGGS